MEMEPKQQTANLQKRLRTQQRRRTEDVDYWRKRAGWFDDDGAMRDYNNGVQDTYYQPGNENDSSSGGSGSGGGMNGAMSSDLAQNVIKALSVLVALGLCILMFRVIARRFGDGKKDKKKRSSSSGRPKSRSRSRSRSRRGEYDLMGEDGEKSRSSKRSSRSKSRGGRSRSRSRARSRSKSRKDSASKNKSAATPSEPVLV